MERVKNSLFLYFIMAVMGRKKQMIANMIAGRGMRINKALQERKEKEKEQEISEEEHQKRLNLLKEAGVLK
ncbi:MAG: hypothetical protein V1886_02525 [archaeon]